MPTVKPEEEPKRKPGKPLNRRLNTSELVRPFERDNPLFYEAKDQIKVRPFCDWPKDGTQ